STRQAASVSKPKVWNGHQWTESVGCVLVTHIPHPLLRVDRDKLAALRRLKYYPKSQERRPPEERDESQALELLDRLIGAVEGRTAALSLRTGRFTSPTAIITGCGA